MMSRWTFIIHICENRKGFFFIFLSTWDEVHGMFLFKMFALHESQYALDTKPYGKMDKINREVFQKSDKWMKRVESEFPQPVYVVMSPLQ